MFQSWENGECKTKESEPIVYLESQISQIVFDPPYIMKRKTQINQRKRNKEHNEKVF